MLVGTGKTFLTSAVIDHVQRVLKLSRNDEGFAYFYCDRNEPERRDPLVILRSYVRQLSTGVWNPNELQKKLRIICRDAKLNGSGLGFEACKQQLLESINLYPKTTLILDALDECIMESRRQLIDIFDFLLSESERPLKVFISSRPDDGIRDRLSSRPNIDIQASNNHRDIETYINVKIVRHPRWKKMPESLQEEIVKTLLEKSDGM